MNCGRHCTYSDYENLSRKTSAFLVELDKYSKNEFKTQLNIYLEFIADFDTQLAEEMRLKIMMADDNLSRISQIINNYIDELKHNVLVDIKEHN